MLKFREFDIKNLINTVRTRSGDNQFDPERAKFVEELVELNMRGAAINAVADMMGESMVPIFKKLIGDELIPPAPSRIVRKTRQVGRVARPDYKPGWGDVLADRFNSSMPPITHPNTPETPEDIQGIFEPTIELTIHPYPDVKPGQDGIYWAFIGERGMAENIWKEMNYKTEFEAFSGPGITHWADLIPNP